MRNNQQLPTYRLCLGTGGAARTPQFPVATQMAMINVQRLYSVS